MAATDETLSGMSEDEREAFRKGYSDFKRGQQSQGSMSLVQPSPKPPAGFEAAYDMGWRRAANENIGEAEKKGHSRESWGYIAVGAILFAGGSAITIGTLIYSEGGTFTFAYGAIVGGLLLMGTGVYKYFSKPSTE